MNGVPEFSVAVRLFAALLLVWLESGCSPSAPKAKSQLEIQAARQQCTQWRLATLVGEYERVGHKNPKWDEDAKAGLEAFALMNFEDSSENQKDLQRMARSLGDAVSEGCDDPLVLDYYTRLIYAEGAHSTNELMDAYLRAAEKLEGSGYCEIRKFYGSLRAAQGISRQIGNSQEIYRLRRQAMSHIAPALEDKDLPPTEAMAACLDLLDTTKLNEKQFPDAYKEIEEPLFKHFSKTAVPYAIKGRFYVEYAWRARGSGYADSVTQEGAKLFEKRLETASSALESGWKIDPSEPFIPTEMLRVELGQGRGRDRMELWFQRAMKADPNNYRACKAKMYYLEPKWYGSYQDMIEFGRECTTNEAWGGFVTSFIADVHQEIAVDSKEGTNYWNRPGVWEDLHLRIEEFFRRNPDAVATHYNYAWYAFACGAWDVVAQQLPLLSEPINYDYFGGPEAFEEMRKQAKLHAKK